MRFWRPSSAISASGSDGAFLKAWGVFLKGVTLTVLEASAIILPRWGYSSAGRALRSHRRGRGFESPYLHQISHRVSCSRGESRNPRGCEMVSQRHGGERTERPSDAEVVLDIIKGGTAVKKIIDIADRYKAEGRRRPTTAESVQDLLDVLGCVSDIVESARTLQRRIERRE